MAGKKKIIPGQNFVQQYAAFLSQYADNRAQGTVFYVNSAVGVDAVGQGFSPDAPYKTINFAVTQCTADNDDVILVLPGHVETIIAAGTLTVAVAGVTIRGIGNGRKRPVINYTTANTASVLVTAARVTLDNLVFTPLGFAAVATPVNVQAADFTMQNCEMELANATNQAVTGVSADNSVGTADRMMIRNNHFHGSSNAGTAKAITFVGGTDIRIEDNIFIGNYTTSIGAIENVTTACVNCMVLRNRIFNRTAAAAKAMVFVAASDGMISFNMMQILTGTAPITGAAMSWVGNNYYVGTIATAGTLI